MAAKRLLNLAKKSKQCQIGFPKCDCVICQANYVWNWQISGNKYAGNLDINRGIVVAPKVSRLIKKLCADQPHLETE
jgi:hypothetical protein